MAGISLYLPGSSQDHNRYLIDEPAAIPFSEADFSVLIREKGSVGAPGRRSPPKRMTYEASTSDHASRNAAVIGKPAARTAGKRLPATPMITAKISP